MWFLYAVSTLGALAGLALLRKPPSFSTAPLKKNDSGTRAAPPKKLRVLTHNCWCHYLATPWGQWKGVKGVASPVIPGTQYADRLGILADHILRDGFDVVMVQEVFVARLGPLIFSGNFQRLARALAKGGLTYHTDPGETLPKFFGQNSGTVIFSRYPLHRMVSCVFQTSAEGVNNKGFSAASIDVQVPDGVREVMFVSTHFDSRNWAAKQRQVHQLAAFVSETASARAEEKVLSSTIIAGDFNLAPQTTEQGGYDDGSQYKVLVEAMDVAGGLKSIFNGTPPSECPLTEGSCTLDHIFLRPAHWQVSNIGSVRYTDLRDRAVSDHLGVVATVTPQ